jgi:hypothetical protein
METTHRTRLISTVAVLSLALTGAACASKASPSGTAPQSTATASQPGTPAPSASPDTPPLSTTRSQPPAAPNGPVWPVTPRTLRAVYPAKAPALTAIRTGRHATYDRLVFDFSGAFGQAHVRYVSVVRADPSDRTVPLRGNAFLEVTIHGAYAQWGDQQPAYTGPTTVTPAYPTLKQVKLSGDFENVLSFGVGVSRTAGFQVMRLQSPDRLVIDVAH